MLRQIANYCPIISRCTLVKNSTSLEYIWQTICQHFGFQATGAQFIDFSDIHLAVDEHPEDLYQCLMAFVEDSLLHATGLTHHGEHVTEDQELTPTLENVVVFTWLRLIHPTLPRLVKQRYGTELRSRTLASIKPEIFQALSSLLEEIRTSDDAKILRAAVADDFRRPCPGGRSVPSSLTMTGLHGKSETDRRHTGRRKTPTTTLILIHPVLKPLCLFLTLLPTVSRPVNLLIWMSFMVTVLYLSLLTVEQLEI